MADRHKLVMATYNPGKLREARAIAGDRLEILGLEDIGYRHDIPETADTLEGNALIKVRAIKDATGMDCFADDTGLLVDALGGAPGVHTARYAGEACDPDANIDLLLRNLDGAADRRARFRTCVALSLDGEEHVFEGSVEGRIATHKSGSHGFGYDPIFIPEETGICFAEMSDEAKNAISHRGRALSAMMKWISTLCVAIFTIFQAHAASSADWRLFNTFDNLVENIFDTPEKTYVLAQAQFYNATVDDNNEKLLFLFAIDKDSGESRAYNPQNFLSRSLIRMADYNARKGYLLIIYDDYTIDFLYDDGTTHTVSVLQSYTPVGSKDVRGISFDPDNDRVYLATDFGYVEIDDKKYEVASSGIYGQPIDKAIRVADRFVVLRDGKIYHDDADSKHAFLSNFIEADWGGDGTATDLLSLASDKCVVARTLNGKASYWMLIFADGQSVPQATAIGNFSSANISENKDGIMLALYGSLYQLDRTTGKILGITRRPEDSNLNAGSWDFKNFTYNLPREGVYTVRYDDGNSWSITSQPARPDAPAVFRSTDIIYTPEHGILANTHGLNQNFTSSQARNPILLSGYKDGGWTMHGIPYFDPATQYRLINPCGIAQDPDNPDVFYFGSQRNGLLRYDITDMSSVLHMTRSDDNPSFPGHVSVRDPYASWKGAFMLMWPKFDLRGNLIMAHLNTEDSKNYVPEIWIWSAEDRRASTSPENFKPFTNLTVEGIKFGNSNLAVPLSYSQNQDMVVYVPIKRYGGEFVVYDHNGTIKETADDRQIVMTELYDTDGSLSVNYLYCAVEDPATGLMWVGTDNGVFTFNPAEAFSNPGKVARIKVSRNDGTSLADYLLSGTSVNNIAIDDLGRKWFSLSGGGLVCTSADGRTILQEIDSDNSMLPSDIVYASCYNPDNNSMIIATSAGLCEYYLNGPTNEAVASEVRAYPNPVRHDYYGWVTIDGLEDDCIVKIADSAGNIVRELGPATAGRVQWDVCGIDLNRVPSGVYYVLASSGPSGGSYSEATKILVINR